MKNTDSHSKIHHPKCWTKIIDKFVYKNYPKVVVALFGEANMYAALN